MKDSIDQLKRGLRAALKAARAQPESPSQDMNVSARKNIVITRNVGQEGSTHTAMAVQNAPVRQKGA